MPIKFACPECKAVMSVADSMAGKKGKCKCGVQVTVPAAKQASSASASQTKSAKTGGASSESSGSLMQVFDDLTDADYNRESPMQKIYAKQVAKNEGATLKRFDKSGDAPKKKPARAKPGVLNGAVILIIVYCLWSALGTLSVIVMLAINFEGLQESAKFSAELRLGQGVGIAYFAMTGALLVAASVGLILKQFWGWILTAGLFTYSLILRLVTVGMMFTGELNSYMLGGGVGSAVFALVFATLIYKEDTRRIYRIESKMLIAIAVAIGIVLAGIAVGLMFGVGAFSPAPEA